MVSFPFGFLIDGESIPRNLEGETEYELFGLATLNVLEHWIVGTGPGLKFKKEESRKLRKLMGRVFLGYIFDLPHEFELTPNASLDFSEGTSTKEINYGITFGKKF